MSNKDKILKLIVEEGEKEAQVILKEGQAEKEKILQEARDNAELKRAEIEEQMRVEVEGVKKRAESQWGIEGRNITLKKKRALISEIFDNIGEKLDNLDADKKVKWYCEIFKKYHTGAPCTLLLNKEEKAAFGELLVKEIGQGEVELSKEEGSFRGGFIISQEKTEINCTLDVLIEEEKRKYESEVAKLLFGKDSI